MYHKTLLVVATYVWNKLNAKAPDAAPIPYKNCHLLSSSKKRICSYQTLIIITFASAGS